MDHHSGRQDRAIIEYLWFSGKGSRIDNPQPNSSPELSPPKHWPGRLLGLDGLLSWRRLYFNHSHRSQRCLQYTDRPWSLKPARTVSGGNGYHCVSVIRERLTPWCCLYPLPLPRPRP